MENEGILKEAGATRPPLRRVQSDSCSVEVEGETYYPHRGEWVDMTRIASARQWLLAMEMSQDGAEANTAKFGEVLQTVADRIVAWNWTDQRGNPLPPPSYDVIRGLSFDEIRWLQQASLGVQPETEESRGNASLPSTSPSTATRKATSRPRG